MNWSKEMLQDLNLNKEREPVILVMVNYYYFWGAPKDLLILLLDGLPATTLKTNKIVLSEERNQTEIGMVGAWNMRTLAPERSAVE